MKFAPGPFNKKPRAEWLGEIRSVLCDDRSAPVEAIDQRGADGLNDRGRSNRKSSQSSTDKGFWQSNVIIFSQAVFPLHEPARSRNAEDVEVFAPPPRNQPLRDMPKSTLLMLWTAPTLRHRSAIG
jgi:hypothetical protein